MRRTTLLLLLVSPLLTLAQSRKQPVTEDSAGFYQRQLYKLQRDNFDSLKRSAEYIAIKEKIEQFRGKSNDYTGSILFGDIMHSDYSKFNNNIVQNGFTPLDPVSFRIGYGVSNKSDHIILDMYFVVAGFSNRSTRGDETIRSSLTNFFQFDLGYDLLRSRKISIYPFAGISIRSSSLSYSKPAQVNSSYTDITNIVINDQSVSSTSTRLGYQAGVGFDVLVSDKKNRSGIYLFTKLGTNGPFGKDRYKIHDIKYKPGIKQGDWLVTFGIKVANWH